MALTFQFYYTLPFMNFISMHYSNVIFIYRQLTKNIRKGLSV